MLSLIFLISRNFLPTLDTFFEDAMDQLDPANEVEEQYL